MNAAWELAQMTDPEAGQPAGSKPEPPAPPVERPPQPAGGTEGQPAQVPEASPYQLAEEGWQELVKAAAKIQAAANAIKKTARSVDGYNMERTLNKHKPHLMAEHLANLREHRKTNKL